MKVTCHRNSKLHFNRAEQADSWLIPVYVRLGSTASWRMAGLAGLGKDLETHPTRGHGKAACVQCCTTLPNCFMGTGHSHQLAVIYRQFIFDWQHSFPSLLTHRHCASWSMAKERASEIWWEREEEAGKREETTFVRLRALAPTGETPSVTQAHRSSSGIFCFGNGADRRGNIWSFTQWAANLSRAKMSLPRSWWSQGAHCATSAKVLSCKISKSKW